MAGAEVGAEVKVHPLVHDAGRDEPLADADDPAGLVARLLGQFPRGRFVGRFARVDGARGDFEKGLTHGVPVVPHEADVIVVHHRDQSDSASV